MRRSFRMESLPRCGIHRTRRQDYRFSLAPRKVNPDRRRTTRSTKLEAMRYILLLIPCLLAVSVPFYNFDAPRLFGVPFFYWSLFAQVPISALFVYAAYRLDRARGRPR